MGCYDRWAAHANNASFAAQAAYDAWVPPLRPCLRSRASAGTRFMMQCASLAALPQDERHAPAGPAATAPPRRLNLSVIHIHHHHLGLEGSPESRFLWAEHMPRNSSTWNAPYEEGDGLDTVYFRRAGVKGTLQVQHNQFELRAELGFLVGAFKGRIERRSPNS